MSNSPTEKGTVEEALAVHLEQQIDAMIPDGRGVRLNSEIARAILAALRSQCDDPEMDGTDAAHPAWWRGNDAGVLGAVEAITRVLDKGKYGTFGSPELEALAQRIDALRSRRAEFAAPSTDKEGES